MAPYPFLACPECKSALTSVQQSLRCDDCGRSFPISNGIPILLSQHISFSPKAAQAHVQSERGYLRSFLTLGTHVGRGHERLFSLCPSGYVVSVGGGPLRERFDYINLNLSPMPNVDIVGDAASLPILDDSLDAVVCNAVLEHVPNPWAVVAEIHRCLKPGGYVLIEVPFLQHYHPSPQDFYRFTIEGIRELGKEFRTIDLGIAVGPMVTLVEMVESFAVVLFGDGKVVKGVVRLTLYPLRLLDPLLVKFRSAHSIANGFYFLGRKKERSISEADYRDNDEDSLTVDPASATL